MSKYLHLPSDIVLREDHIIAVLSHAVDWAHGDMTFFYRKDEKTSPIALLEVGRKQVAVTITQEDCAFLKNELCSPVAVGPSA